MERKEKKNCVNNSSKEKREGTVLAVVKKWKEKQYSRSSRRIQGVSEHHTVF